MKALIFGVTGQDGSYLAEFLLSKKYNVVGVRRRTSSGSLWRLKTCLNNDNFTLVEGDITDQSCILNLLSIYQPHEIYNLAAQSNVGTSFNQPGLTWDITAKGVLNLLEVMRLTNSKAKLYQASSSEMFGDSFSFWTLDEKDNPIQYHKDQCLNSEFRIKPYNKPIGDFQNETTPFNPQSPYGIAKLAAHNMIRLYREAYGLYAVGGILFNHESPRRGLNFVTRKITNWLKQEMQFFNEYHVNPGWHLIKENKVLKLGNLDSYRDWGYAKEYVEAMWLILQQPNPKDYVIGTGETHSIKEFLIEVFKYYEIDNFNKYIEIDDNYKRPAEVPYLKADASLARKELGWEPKTKFEDLVRIMCEEENGQP